MKYIAAALLLVAAMSAQNAPSTSKSPDLDIPAIAREANGSVVSIVMSDKDGHPLAQGSGFLISKDGRIVTNYHVIKNGSSAVIKLPDGAFFAVDGVLASDKNRDIAIIKAHGNNFRSLTLGDSDRLQVGQQVIAIGSPLSLESTVSNGIISGIRTVEEEGGKFVQITVPISPCSSGGPLFNMAGKVVGITTSHLVGGENLNFAIPINAVKPMLLSKFSKVRPLPEEAEPVTVEQTTDGSPLLRTLGWMQSTLANGDGNNIYRNGTLHWTDYTYLSLDYDISTCKMSINYENVQHADKDGDDHTKDFRSSHSVSFELKDIDPTATTLDKSPWMPDIGRGWHLTDVYVRTAFDNLIWPHFDTYNWPHLINKDAGPVRQKSYGPSRDGVQRKGRRTLRRLRGIWRVLPTGEQHHLFRQTNIFIIWNQSLREN
jgi:S1-C subfamily serine protease